MWFRDMRIMLQFLGFSLSKDTHRRNMVLLALARVTALALSGSEVPNACGTENIQHIFVD